MTQKFAYDKETDTTMFECVFCGTLNPIKGTYEYGFYISCVCCGLEDDVEAID